MSSRKTYFIDIDGTLLEHLEPFDIAVVAEEILSLPGAKEKTIKWHCEGHLVILVTARPESMRSITMKQLANAHIMYTHLLMDMGQGERILINDFVEENRATAYNVLRNVDGIQKVP